MRVLDPSLTNTGSPRGSYTDGGAFIFSLQDAADGSGNKRLVCADKFGKVIETPGTKSYAMFQSSGNRRKASPSKKVSAICFRKLRLLRPKKFLLMSGCYQDIHPEEFKIAIETIKNQASKGDAARETAILALTLLYDCRYDTGKIKRSSVQHVLKINLDDILSATHMITENAPSKFVQVDFATRNAVKTPRNDDETLIINAEHFEPEGENCDAVLIVKAINLAGGDCPVQVPRPAFYGVWLRSLDERRQNRCYGSSGDYLHRALTVWKSTCTATPGSTRPGYERRQAGGICDVGQTFMYGAKGWHRLRHGERRRTASHQCGWQAARGNQWHRPGLPGRILYGGDALAGGGFII